ncbi:serine recombinase [Dyella lipolytica]|uniref:Recombinase family protein n=1 Tax=Dyella lipolytica TaxID=1867835 RepID=A0ABW8ISU8_9GAMM|nr:recombinase family protein [Dyella lipolytica]GLQ46722.1 serine recombinase [Dyella lipolytica]
MSTLGYSYEPNSEGEVIRVAQYVRMSTEHQQYSTENQRSVNEAYAAAHGMVIVRTYADDGKSGLRLTGRHALQRLLKDVQASPLPFTSLLVYDVSRWGRFQDADESAYYEFLCRRAGVNVEYCTEPFENDGTPASTLMKSIKRWMAGEYSRELSNKVFYGQSRQIRLGFHQGGTAGFGLRRQLLDERCRPKLLLKRGEVKNLRTEHVKLVQGPPNETAVVMRIYDMFVRQRCTMAYIAEQLNGERVCTDLGRTWTPTTIRSVLTNEKYIGNSVYNRTSFKLKHRRQVNSPDTWVRHDGAFEAVISSALFVQAKAIFAEKAKRFPKELMLSDLRKLFEKEGYLSAPLINAQANMPKAATYKTRFKGLVDAYALIGVQPTKQHAYVHINRERRQVHHDFVEQLCAALEGAGASVAIRDHHRLLIINDELTLWVAVARRYDMCGRIPRWRSWPCYPTECDIAVIMRVGPDNRTAMDYYIFPGIDLPARVIALAEDHNELGIDTYRFQSLEPLLDIARRGPLAKLP